MTSYAGIAANLGEVRDRIGEAAIRAGRMPEAVRLVAVTKTFPPEAVVAAWEAGQREFGENRPEEGAAKITDVMRHLAAGTPDAGVVWHMIGHIQSRKTGTVAEHFHIVHSLDRFKVARRLSACFAEAERALPVLMECNVSGETSKYGYAARDWERDAKVREVLQEEVGRVAALPGLDLQGLMTMAPLVDDAEEVRWVFASLRALREALRERVPELALPHLSMGMTSDFEVAIEEGATLVRIGRAIFGARSAG